MPQFKLASRTPESLDAAKVELDDIFNIVKGKNGVPVASAIKKLDDNRYEIAQLIVSIINDTYTLTDPLPFLVDEITGNIQDKNLWRRMDSNLRVVNRSYGTKPLSQRLTFKEFSMQTSMKEVAVEIPLEEIAAGSTTASQVTDAITSAILRYRVAAVLDGIDAGVTAGADHSGEPGYTLRYTGFTQANLDKAIDGVSDEGDTPTIFGRHVAINPVIRSFTGFSQDILTQLQTRGLLATYNGANIVTLKDGYSNRDGSHAIRRDRVYIASGRKGAYYMTKDVSFLNWAMVDPRSSTFGVGTRIEDGVLVWDPFQYRIIER